MQKREDVISKEGFIKLSNELDELKAFKDVPSTKIKDIKTNLNKVSGSFFIWKNANFKIIKTRFVCTRKTISLAN